MQLICTCRCFLGHFESAIYLNDRYAKLSFNSQEIVSKNKKLKSKPAPSKKTDDSDSVEESEDLIKVDSEL